MQFSFKSQIVDEGSAGDCSFFCLIKQRRLQQNVEPRIYLGSGSPHIPITESERKRFPSIINAAHNLFHRNYLQLQDSDYTCDEAKFAVNELIRLDLYSDVCEMMLANVDYILRQQIAPKFWQYFRQSNDVENGFYQFQLSVHELHREYEKICRALAPLSIVKQNSNVDFKQKLNESLKVILLSQLPANFNKIVYSFYHISFKVFANSHQDSGLCASESIRP